MELILDSLKQSKNLIDSATEKQCKEGIRHMEYEEMKTDEFKARTKFMTFLVPYSMINGKKFICYPGFVL